MKGTERPLKDYFLAVPDIFVELQPTETLLNGALSGQALSEQCIYQVLAKINKGVERLYPYKPHMEIEIRPSYRLSSLTNLEESFYRKGDLSLS